MKTTEHTTPSRLGELILAWLLVHRDGGTVHEIEKQLRPTLEQRFPTLPERRRTIDEELGSLKQGGYVKAVRRSSFAVSANGERAALGAMGLKALPAMANWRTVREILFIHWILQFVLFTTVEAAAPPPKKQMPLPADDKAFTQCVLAAARASKTGRFGDDKVFISHIVQQLEAGGYAVGDVEAFKNRLVAVHRGRLLSMSRADLVQAMDPGDVDASETKYLSARFHFVSI